MKTSTRYLSISALAGAILFAGMTTAVAKPLKFRNGPSVKITEVSKASKDTDKGQTEKTALRPAGPQSKVRTAR